MIGWLVLPVTDDVDNGPGAQLSGQFYCLHCPETSGGLGQSVPCLCLHQSGSPHHPIPDGEIQFSSMPTTGHMRDKDGQLKSEYMVSQDDLRQRNVGWVWFRGARAGGGPTSQPHTIAKRLFEIF
jgi:hypothetical protein